MLEESYKKREFQSALKKETILLQREERLENVKRISKANEYQNKKISEKIEMDKLKGEQIMKEKADMLESRFTVRRQAEKEKRELIDNVEQLKKKGNLNK